MTHYKKHISQFAMVFVTKTSNIEQIFLQVVGVNNADLKNIGYIQKNVCQPIKFIDKNTGFHTISVGGHVQF